MQLNETEKTALSFLMSCGIITETSEIDFNDGRINIEKNNSDITMALSYVPRSSGEELQYHS